MTDGEAGRARGVVDRNAPDPCWPGGTHAVCHFAISSEEGGEYRVPDGDAIEGVLREDPPRMLSSGLRNRIIAHPGRAMGRARLLDRIADHPRVTLMRRVNVARHWRPEHPPR